MVLKIVKNRFIFWGLLIFGVFTVILGVNFYFKIQEKEIKEAKKEELSSIATLKIKAISEWYVDELNDASIIVSDKDLIALTKKWLTNNSSSNQSELEYMLNQLNQEHGLYSLTILSTDFSRNISTIKTVFPFGTETLGSFENAKTNRKVSSSDIFLCKEDGNNYIDFIAPVVEKKSEVLALVIFRHNVKEFLYPLIESWPVKTRTAESLLLRKENDHVLYLNKLSNLTDTSLKYRIPLTRRDVPSVNAALGYKGFVEGVDYRNSKVLSYCDSIPGTPWFMVSKIDVSELYDHFFFKTATPLILSLAGVFILGMFFYLVYVRRQKNLYKQLYDSQQEYKTMLYSIGDAVITTNHVGEIVALNPMAEKLTGWAEDEAKGKHVEEVFVIIQEESRESVVSPVKRVLEEGLIVGLANHTILISKQGKEIPISDSGAPIFGSKGEIVGVVLVFRDQTNERVREKALFEAKRKMSTLLSNLPGMAYRCANDLNWTMEFVSKGCEELTGYSCWEIEGNQMVSYGNIIYPEDRGYVWGEVEKALDANEPFQIEYRIVTKQGDIEWVWEQGRGVLNEKGELDAIEGFITKITSKKNAEIALTENEEIFNHFLEHSPIYIFFKDENIRSLKLSRNFEQMLGKPLSELLGKNMFELFPTDFARKMVDDDLEVITRNEVITLEENFNGRNYLTIKFPVRIEGKQTYLAGFNVDINEWKRLEQSLAESEKLFQTMAENISVGIFRTNREGNTIYVNPAWCSLSGATKVEAMGEGWLSHVHPDDQKEIIKGWVKAVETNSISNAEYRFIAADGKIVWVKGTAVPEFDDNGELMGYIGSVIDVTEIMNATETSHRATQLLRTVIDNIPDAIYMKDIEGRKVIANKADVINLGANSEKEVLGKNDFDFFSPEIAEQLWADDLQVLRDGIPVIRREEKLQNLKGKEKWISTSKIPFRDKKGKIIGLVGIGHDITKQKSNEAEMLKLTKAVTQSPVSIVITNLKGDIEYVNPKFTEITGYSFEEAVGQNPRILKSGKQNKEFYALMWSTILTGNDWTCEMQNKKKNGELYWESVKISPILNDNNEIIYFVAVKEDITEKKVIQAQLIDAKEKAEESDRLKSAFLANMSHEIRTPLNSILGFSNFLTGEDELSKEEKGEYSNIINKSADSLLQIINDIIDISSLETGQLKTFITPVKVNEVLQSLFLVFSRKLIELNKSHLILDLVVSDELVVMADENRFIQIMTNLANNAMKFTERGTIRFGIENHDEKKVVFFVSDTGIGIKKEMHDSIFERFRQVENNKSRIFGGNGLGLAIVKNLVELMGGEIGIESEVGKGSIFRFWLPKGNER
jgi:PAS domain S-box-containing protein